MEQVKIIEDTNECAQTCGCCFVANTYGEEALINTQELAEALVKQLKVTVFLKPGVGSSGTSLWVKKVWVARASDCCELYRRGFKAGQKQK